MNNETQKLIDLLEETANLLRSHGVDYWADWLSRDMARLKDGDCYSVEHLLSAYGGMGSFTDVFICPENGDRIQKNEVIRVNRRLDELRGAIYGVAERIKNRGGVPPRAA